MPGIERAPRPAVQPASTAVTAAAASAIARVPRWLRSAMTARGGEERRHRDSRSEQHPVSHAALAGGRCRRCRTPRRCARAAAPRRARRRSGRRRRRARSAREARRPSSSAATASALSTCTSATMWNTVARRVATVTSPNASSARTARSASRSPSPSEGIARASPRASPIAGSSAQERARVCPYGRRTRASAARRRSGRLRAVPREGAGQRRPRDRSARCASAAAVAASRSACTVTSATATRAPPQRRHSEAERDHGPDDGAVHGCDLGEPDHHGEQRQAGAGAEQAGDEQDAQLGDQRLGQGEREREQDERDRQQCEPGEEAVRMWQEDRGGEARARASASPPSTTAGARGRAPRTRAGVPRGSS